MTIQFAPATTVPDYYADDRRTAGDGAGSRFWPGFSVGACAATMAGALIAMGSLLADRAPLFEIDGTVTLIDGATSSSTSGFDCEAPTATTTSLLPPRSGYPTTPEPCSRLVRSHTA